MDSHEHAVKVLFTHVGTPSTVIVTCINSHWNNLYDIRFRNHRYNQKAYQKQPQWQIKIPSDVVQPFTWYVCIMPPHGRMHMSPFRSGTGGGAPPPFTFQGFLVPRTVVLESSSVFHPCERTRQRRCEYPPPPIPTDRCIGDAAADEPAREG